MTNCISNDCHAGILPGKKGLYKLFFGFAFIVSLVLCLSVSAQDHKPTRPGSIALPENYKPKEIADIFLKNAVQYADMVERAKFFKFIPHEIVVAVNLKMSKKDARKQLIHQSWTNVFGGANFKMKKIVLVHERTPGNSTAILIFNLASGSDVFRTMKSIEGNESVLWSCPNFYVEGDPRDYTPNDTRYAEQYHHPLMKNNLAWDITKGSPNVVVAVTDDGVETTHTDLSANVWINTLEIPGDGIDNDNNGYIDDVKGWDFDNDNNNPDPNVTTDDHGTHVAGIVAARMDNNIGVTGVAGLSKVMALQFYGTGGSAWTASLVAESFAYAVDNGAKILNTSYNIDGFSSDPVFIAGAQYVLDNDVLYLNSAGNNGQLNPARQVVTQSLLVANTTSTDTRSSSSNYGNGIDISAPGTSILSSVTNGGYANFSGTSMSTPNAAGAAALIWSAFPTFNAYQVATLLLATADDITTQNPSIPGLLGSGRVNSYAAISATIPAPKVKNITGLPANGSGTISAITSFTVAFNQVMDPVTMNNLNNFELRGAGPNNTFNDGDDMIYTLFPSTPYRIGTNFLTYSFNGPLPCGSYRLTLIAGGLRNPFGSALDGDGNNSGGDNYLHNFYISPGYFVDADNDGFGTGDPVYNLGCQLPAGYSVTNGDCDDSNAQISPGRPELCNGLDDNCDGFVDQLLQAGANATFSNSTPIIIPSTGNPGLASVYPSIINVSGISEPIHNISVKLKKLNHSWVNEVDILLEGPAGQKMIILSDVGSSSNDPVNADITLTDSSAVTLTANSVVATGSYKPSNVGTNDNFPTPAPTSPYASPGSAGSATFSSVFGGANANGDWKLYVVDDASSDGGTINEGWEIYITTVSSACKSIEAPVVEVTQPTCSTGGSITVISPLNASYTYSIGGAYQTGALFNGLGAGNYSVTVKDDLSNVSPATEIVLELTGGATWYLDNDGDGFGNAAMSITSCTQPAGYVTNSLDCNDSNNTVYPGAPELCDGLDNDCDSSVDEDGGATWYLDNDGDSFGNAAMSTTSCTQPAGYVTNSLDCDDADNTVYPGAPELCDGKDNDCNDAIDDGAGTTTYYQDLDGDGFGNSTVSVTGCNIPAGYVATADDCNDNNNAVYPGAPELCDGLDNNCDGNTDGPPALPFVTGITNACEFEGTGQEVIFLANSLGAGSFVWTVPPTVNIISGQGTDSLTVTILTGFAASGNKQIRVVAANECGSSGMYIHYLLAQTPITPGAITGLTQPCSLIGTGTATTYSVSPVTGATGYVWTMPAGAMISQYNGASVNVIFNPGFIGGEIGVVATNQCGQSNRPRKLMLSGGGAPGQPGLITGNTNACISMPTPLSPLGVEETYSIRRVALATGYTWTAPQGAVITGHPAGSGLNDTIITVRYSSNFSGGAIAVVATGQCGQSAARILNIGASINPGTPGAIDVQLVDICPERIFRYSINVYNASYYNWVVPFGGTILSGQGTPEITVLYHAATVSGNITVTAGNGCSAGKTRTLQVKLVNCTPPPPFFVKSKEDEKTMFDVSVFPNPTSGAFNLKTNGNDNTPIGLSLYDVWGKLVWQKKVTTGETIFLDVKLPQGAYFLLAEQKDRRKTLRLVKQ